jgi:hypothetical protein
MKKKQLVKIHAALLEIKAGERNEKNGICINLYTKVDSTDAVEEFISLVFEEVYGDPEVLYPIEGDRFLHQQSKCKWNPYTDYGKLRLALLDSMIEYCTSRGVQ